MRSIPWNNELRLVFSDVDETVADLYRPAEAPMLKALARLLDQGIRLVLITGQSIGNVEARVVMGLPARLRQRAAVGACSGAELWGYAATGERHATAFYTVETVLDAEQKTAWRAVVKELIAEFRLLPFPPLPIAEFARLHGDAPWHVMLDDRGPQITLEFPNAYRLTDAASERLARRLGIVLGERDLRVPVLRRARHLLEAKAVPITPRLAGIFALDFAISGASKRRAVEAALTPAVLAALGLGSRVPRAAEIEVWGDRFSQAAGTDWLMCRALDPHVRAISFRDEDPSDFPPGYDIRLWDGAARLQAGLLEYLKVGGNGAAALRSTVADE